MNMLINRNNYEEFFVLYVDNELSVGDRIAVEKFIAANPDLQEELILLQETVLVADNEIIFEHKEELYKQERKVIGLAWWRVAAAVLLLFGAGVWGWKKLDKEKIDTHIAEISPVISESPATSIIEKPLSPVVSQVRAPEQHVKVNSRPRTIVERRDIPVNKEIKKQIQLNLPTDLSVTSIEPPTENVAINVVPLKITEEPIEQGNKMPAYEYVDISENDDAIYVANTSVSKRNKFRGVIRKATRILDRVTSAQ